MKTCKIPAIKNETAAKIPPAVIFLRGVMRNTFLRAKFQKIGQIAVY